MMEPQLPTQGGATQPVQEPADPRQDSLWLLEFHIVREKLAGYTTFPPAGELALGLAPSSDPVEVSVRQSETTEARRLLDGGSTPDLAEAKDLRMPLQRAALGGTLTGEELREVHDTLKTSRGTRADILRQREMPILRALAQDLPVIRDLERELAASIGPAGDVLDSASPILKELRSEARDAYQRLMDTLERTERRLLRQGILQEPIITQRNGRMVLLVKTEMKHRLPGIVHDVSDSGATLFVEPMGAIGLGNRWRESYLAQGREEERVLRSLSEAVGGHSNDLLRWMELLARLDVAMAKARYAIAIGATAPTVIETEGPYIRLLDVRHPLLEGEVVPITVELGEGQSIMLVTGPNAGGKTVALKTIGIMCLMAQSGLHVPAREATLAIFDGVYADIGDQQSIQRSLSTFSSHIQNLRTIMEEVTDRSLVLIDELGTSTDPEQGASLAKAILRYFSRRGCAVVATTHQRDVAAFVQEQPGMMNASVELDPSTLSPSYRLTQGLPGRSYALTIASRLGLSDEIIQDARSMLSPVHQQAETLLKGLQEERHLAEEKRTEAEEAASRAESRSADLEEQLLAIQDSKAEMVEEARHDLQRMADDVARRLRSAEKALVELKPRPVAPEIKGARKEIAQVRRELRSPEWQPPPSRRGEWVKHIQSGDRVHLKGIPQPVEVIAPPKEGGTVEVLLGTMRARLPVHHLDRPARAYTTPSRDGIYFSRRSKGRIDPELDLRGARVEEALDRIDTFLNDATVSGLSSVRIGHGVGTGALRGAIREYLGHHPLAKSVGRVEGIGPDAVTVVELT